MGRSRKRQHQNSRETDQVPIKPFGTICHRRVEFAHRDAMNPYLLLAAAEGCGPGMIPALLDPAREPAELLVTPPRLPRAAWNRLRSKHLRDVAAANHDRAIAAGLTELTPSDLAYPDRLRRLPLRPNTLYARGDLTLLTNHRAGLAIVGSRTHSAYGEAAARDFAGAAARAGVVLWSGLALGIDSIAHREALAHDTPTVAVLAGGLDTIYPHCHAELADRIVDGGGLLISEAPPGLRAQRGHFPRRNRILAAAARAVLVVEAGLRSGSLHTVRFAADFGVPVFAVPGPYTSPRSIGCHTLIAQGGSIATSPEELLRDLGIEASLRDPASSTRFFEDAADEEAVLRELLQGPRPTDLVARETGLAPARFLAAVLSLTEERRIHQLPGDLLAIVRTNT